MAVTHLVIAMNAHKSPLQNLKVANPCPVSWREMEGDDRTRFCSHCRLNVYNLSEMSTAEAEDLIRSREGRLCVRYYQRTDGRVMTKDCPKGLMAVRVKLARSIAVVACLLVGGFGIATLNNPRPERTWVDEAVEKGRSVPGIDKLMDKICPPSIQGDMVGAMPSPSPTSHP
jgi:hypothetical protein